MPTFVSMATKKLQLDWIRMVRSASVTALKIFIKEEKRIRWLFSHLSSLYWQGSQYIHKGTSLSKSVGDIP